MNKILKQINNMYKKINKKYNKLFIRMPTSTRIHEEWKDNVTPFKVRQFIQKSLEDQRKELIREVGKLRFRKFPIGERQWCIQCASRIYKQLNSK